MVHVSTPGRREIDHKRQQANEHAVLLVAILSSFLNPFMASSVIIALPAIARAFSLNAVLTNWVSTSYLIASAIFLLPLGRAADLLGRKRIFTAGIAIFTLMSFLMPLAPNMPIFLLFRIFQGIGGAMIFSTSVAILASVYRPEKRGWALGISVSAVYAGLTLGPFIGGFLTERFGWQSIFLVCVPLGMLVIMLAVLRIDEEKSETASPSFDFLGSVIYSVSLVSIMMGFTYLPGILGWFFMISGAGFFVIFMKWEKAIASPILDISLLVNNKVFAFSNTAALIHYSATFSVSFLLSLYLQYVRGMDPEHAGLILVTQPAVMTVFSPLAGILSDRVEPRFIASAGMAITAIGLFMLSLVGPHTHIVFIIGCLAFLGFGFALFSSPNTNAVMSSVDRKDYGMASGFLSTMRVTGQTLSMGAVLVLFSLLIGRARISEADSSEFIKAFKMGLVFFSLVCIPGILASLARGNVRE
jgi:EmrB/QacA subfamily drug resistance transporter